MEVVKPWEDTIRRASGLIEHVCKHGVGHPAIGSVLWMAANGMKDMGVHGCDGCCRSPEWQLTDAIDGLKIATMHMFQFRKAAYASVAKQNAHPRGTAAPAGTVQGDVGFREDQ